MVRAKIPGHLEDQIRTAVLANPNWTAAQVHEWLNRGQNTDLVSLRTVQRRHRELHSESDDLATEWAFEDNEPEDAALVLEVLRVWDALSHQEGRGRKWRLPWVTRGLAGKIVAVKRAYPDIDDLYAFVVAFELWKRRDGGEPGIPEQMLVYTPWRDRGAALEEAAADDRVHPAVMEMLGYKRVHIADPEGEFVQIEFRDESGELEPGAHFLGSESFRQIADSLDAKTASRVRMEWRLTDPDWSWQEEEPH
jgi:hypothetical protein